MKLIFLKKNVYAKVDDEDYEYLNQWKWTFDGRYAQRNDYSTGKKVKLYMHRELLKPESRQVIDHINHDKLDNQKSNIRISTPAENSMNRSKQANNTTGYKGVSYFKAGKRQRRWLATLKVGDKTFKKYCLTAKEAAIHYDVLAKEHYGDFAILNFGDI